MRKYMINLIAAWLVAAISVGLALPAHAHGIIAAASPTANQQLRAGKIPIRLEFNERIDKVRSRLQITAPDGSKADIAIDADGGPNVLTGTTADLASGAYVLRWQVLAVDGHITRGDIPFTVGQ